MLLLLTSSGDGTSDILARGLKNRLFRLNFDHLPDYKGYLTPDSWEFINAVGHSISSQVAKTTMIWKPFFDTNQIYDKLIADEAKYVFRELYSWFIENGKIKGNPLDFHNKYGKIRILGKAQKYFRIPRTIFTVSLHNQEYIDKSARITKTLSSSLTSDGKALFTTDISNKNLDRKFPWLIQEKISSDCDVTCFVVGDEKFLFHRDRRSLVGLDWRAEQSFDIDKEEWVFEPITNFERDQLESLNSDLGVSWGRYDFMRDPDGSLVFLEFNANGQWVFLDYHNKHGLVDAVLKYLEN